PRRRRHDHAAVALAGHVRPGSPGRVERTTDVHGEVALEVGGVDVWEAGPAHDAGVVDQDVDAPEPVDGGGDERAGPGRGRHVAVVGDRLAPGPCDLGDDLVSWRGVLTIAPHRAAEVVDDHARAARREQRRVGAADAAPRAGDDGDASLEAELVQAATDA